MIILLMIPFFLLVRLSMDDSGWSHGPVYTYNVDVRISDVNQQTSLQRGNFSMTSALKCRPRAPDTLNCRFDNTTMRLFQWQDLANLSVLDSIWDWDMDEEPFEVIFGRTGVSRLATTKSFSPAIIDGLKAIVNQLNFGSNLRNTDQEGFTAIEKSYIGECETSFRISHKPSINSWGADVFQIAPLAGLRKSSGEMMEIAKYRNLNKCVDKADYFFGSNTVDSSNSINMMSSESYIRISDGEYMGYTVNEFVVTNKNSGKDLKLREKIILELKSIVPDKSGYTICDKSTGPCIPGHRQEEVAQEEKI